MTKQEQLRRLRFGCGVFGMLVGLWLTASSAVRPGLNLRDSLAGLAVYTVGLAVSVREAVR